MSTKRHLQTSPYIQLVNQLHDNCIQVYDMGNGRTYMLDSQQATILHRCKTKQALKDLNEQFDGNVVQRLAEMRLMVEPETAWDVHCVRRVEIETGTACNWQCEYCPNRSSPKPKQTMSMDLFEMIIAKAARQPTLEAVTLHSYNEPTLDELFTERIKVLKKAGVKLDLYTNGSTLSDQKLQLLKDSGVMRHLYFNLPTINEKRFESMTGSKTYKQTLRHIDQAIALGFTTRFNVIVRDTKESAMNVQQIRQRYGSRVNGAVQAAPALDRAGLLANQYARKITIEAPLLSGCPLALYQINIGVTGNCYICCEDFHQKETYAHIQDGELNEILNCEKAKQMRKHIFGGEIAPDHFICRRCKQMVNSAAVQNPFRY